MWSSVCLFCPVRGEILQRNSFEIRIKLFNLNLFYLKSKQMFIDDNFQLKTLSTFNCQSPLNR